MLSTATYKKLYSTKLPIIHIFHEIKAYIRWYVMELSIYIIGVIINMIQFELCDNPNGGWHLLCLHVCLLLLSIWMYLCLCVAVGVGIH